MAVDQLTETPTLERLNQSINSTHQLGQSTVTATNLVNRFIWESQKKKTSEPPK